MKTHQIVRSVTLGSIALLAACGSMELEAEVGRKAIRPTEWLDRSPVRAPLDVAELNEPWTNDGPAVAIEGDEGSDAASRIGGDQMVELDLRGKALGEALALIADLAQINLVLDAGLGQPVDASFPRVKLSDALQILLDSNGLELVEDPPGIFWVRDFGASGGQVASFDLGALTASDALASLEALVGSSATVVADDNQNVIVVRGDRDAIEIARRFLERADRVKPQVLVEVHIMEAAVDEQFELGVAHAIQGTIDGDPFNVNQNLATSNAGLFSGVISLANGDVNTTVNMLQDYVDLEIISTPRVLAVTNTTATIEVVEEVPYIETTTDTSTEGGSSTTTQEEVEYKEAGVRLSVTPIIQESGVLQMRVEKELSEVSGFFQNIPIIDKRSLTSDFMVADKQTIVLGGLMQDRRSDNETGVPLLKDIPLVGRLFRSDLDESTKRELLVFVTPRIVDPNEAAVLARRYRDHYEETRRGFQFDDTRR